MTEQPEETFFIDEVVGGSKEEYDEIMTKMHNLEESDMDMIDVVKNAVNSRNPYDVMIGFKLATLLYKNEGRL